MTRNIHNPKTPAIGKIQGGKAQLNGDAAFFFFLEPVRIRSCEGADKAGFSMVNVTGRTQNNFFQDSSHSQGSVAVVGDEGLPPSAVGQEGGLLPWNPVRIRA
jgi:hypothetical protein